MRGYLFYVFLENVQGLKSLFIPNKMNVIAREKALLVARNHVEDLT